MNSRKAYHYLLIPFALLYGGIVLLRNKLFDWEILPSREFPMPVISVGNITVGGTGKTPHVEYLIRLLEDEYKLAVLSRGYKRKTKGFILAGPGSDSDQVGDEPMQIFRKFPDVLVAVDEKRSRGIQNLMDMENGPDVILLDDAFQHRYVKPGFNILLEDYNRPLKNDLLLPVGRLREFRSAAKRANIILITKSPQSMKAIDQRILAREKNLEELQHLYYTSMKADEFLPVFEGSINPYSNSKPRILLFSGIANPRNIKPFVRSLSTDFEELVYADHHPYSEQDIRAIISHYNQNKNDNKIILTTEKDAVKIRKFKSLFEGITDRVFYLSISVFFLNNDGENFNSQIRNYVRSNKRNSILHQKGS